MPSGLLKELMPVIRARELRKVYGSGPAAVEALRAVSLEVHEGEFVSVMGASGSGKSTLLHVLGCLHASSGGHYELDGTSVDGLDDVELSRLRNKKIGVVFQQYNLLPHEDIVANVALPLVYSGVGRVDRERRAAGILCDLGLEDRLAHRPAELSGGQGQRVAIARALVNDPAIILADEPTGNLDYVTGNEIMAVFQKLNRMGRTIIPVTHDREKADYSSRIIHLKDGLVDSEEKLQSPREAPDIDMRLPAEEGP